MSQYGAVGHSFDVYAVALNSNLIPVTGKIIFQMSRIQLHTIPAFVNSNMIFTSLHKI